MKNLIKTLAVLVSIVLATSCGHNTGHEQNHAEPQAKPEQTEEQHHEEGTLRLDDGKPWKANPETSSGINNMMILMADFPDSNNTAGYDFLKKELQAEFSLIIKQCTMTGEAHNQLHNFLMPMKDLFDGIGSNDLTTCQTNFNQLNEHLAEYQRYFINE